MIKRPCPTREEGTNQRVNALDSWRCIAITLVLLAHLSLSEDVKSWLIDFHISWLGSYGNIGVFIFFFISGLVVSKAALAEKKSRENFSIRAFYIRRIFRILPPLALYLILMLCLGYASLVEFSFSNAAPAFAYVCNISLVQCTWLAGHTWSLAFEEQFYLLFPFLFKLAEFNDKPKPIFYVFVLCALLPFIFPMQWIGRTGFILIYVLFFAGYLIARNPKLESKLQSISPLVFALSVCVTFSAEHWFQGQVFEKYAKFLFILSIPCMVAYSVSENSIVRTVLNFKPLWYVGRASYSIYLWQQFVTSDLFWKMPFSTRAVSVVLLFVISLLLFEAVEKRLIASGRKLANIYR